MKFVLPFLCFASALLLPSPETAKAQLPGQSKLAEKDLSTDSRRAKKLFEKGIEAFENRRFLEGMDYMEEATEKDPAFQEAWMALALNSRMLTPPRDNTPYLEKLVELQGDNPQRIGIYLLLSRKYLQKGQYKKALPHLETYLKEGKGPPEKVLEARVLKQKCEFALEALQAPLDLEPKPLSPKVNALNLQYFPKLTADERIMVFIGRESSDPYDDEDIYVTQKNQEDEWRKPQPISPKINTRANEGTCTISADGRILVFVSCGTSRGGSRGDCDLFICKRRGNRWGHPKRLPPQVNSRNWDSHPSLSADGRTLYFTSSRPGGNGGKDIWVARQNNKGKWQTATPMEKPINSAFDEISPFIHANGRSLFFASNGRPGMGAFDLYVTERNDSGGWSQPRNLGYPINTYESETAFFVTASGNWAYYNKDRYDQNKRSNTSEIYRVKLPQSVAPSYTTNYVKGTVFDQETERKLEATVELVNTETGQTVNKVNSDPRFGDYLIVLPEGGKYALHVSKKGYLFKSMAFNYKKSENRSDKQIDIPLEPIKAGKHTTLNNIFFETDKHQILPESVPELKRVYQFLKANKGTKIIIEGHTDNQGSQAYNKELSHKRAKAVYDFLREKGVPEDLISYEGFGEKQPIAPNDTPEGRAKNRRIEFRIKE